MSDQKARQNWSRYQYVKQRGHTEYIETAYELEGLYLGGGRQWLDSDRQALAEAGRPAFEVNLAKPKVDAALGYQIANRMDISYRPRRGDATQELAGTLSKLAMHISDANQYQWQESQIFADGLIQQRGYFEMYMSYEDSLLGEVRIKTLDPMDVMPDPDARSYDPDEWGDVIIQKWLTLDEIEVLYGTKKRNEVEAEGFNDDADNDEDRAARSRFGDANTSLESDTYTDSDGVRRIRVIDRQFWQMTKAKVLISMNGDIRIIENTPQSRIEAMLADGAIQQTRRMRRVRWLVTTACTTLFDDFSPFYHFTVVPYFPYFRRGQTRGLLDNASGPQMILNKAISQFIHIINTTANSGWISWEDTLANMEEDELEDRGAETGLNIVVRGDTPGDKVPQKIQPNQVPQGLDRMIERITAMLGQVMGINEALLGQQGPETSGIAIQSRQHAAQQQLAIPLDNLARTRHMIAVRMLDMLQAFYDDERVERITETNARGQEEVTELHLNTPTDDGILNDLTLGEYDVTITEVPQQITFENSQFLQCLEMVDKGAPIPWPFVLRYSNLAQKQEIIDALEQQTGQSDPVMDAKVKLIEAQAEKTKAETVSKSVESLYSGIQTAGAIAANPAVSPLGDALLKSAGYVDKDSAPILPIQEAANMAPPVDGQQPLAEIPTNTNPMTPANPGVGMNAGIETPDLGAGV